MLFNKHLNLEGQHAFLSASKYHWTQYDEEKLANAFTKYQAAQRGTKLHSIAKDLIDEKINLPRTKQTLNMYVNDAIGFKMETEQTLWYSENCFGTADAIGFRKNFLRIFDLKTGVSPTSIKQLEIYAALFCLEYNINPNNIKIELRLYQSNDIVVSEPLPDDITYIMNKIIVFDKQIEKMKMGE